MWWLGGEQAGPAPETNPFRQAVGNIVEATGDFFGGDEGYLSEKIAGGPTMHTDSRFVRDAYADDTLDKSGSTNDFIGPQNFVGPQNKPSTSTASSGGGGGGGDPREQGFSMDFYQGWDENAAREDWKATGGAKGKQGGGGGGGTIEDLINSGYAESLQALADYEGVLGKRQGERVGDVEGEFGRGEGLIEQEGLDLEQLLKQQGLDLQAGARSAQDEARRVVNSLRQQALSGYGRGSSVGGALSEILGQEYLRTTGQQRETTRQGEAGIAAELAKTKRYIGGKLNDLTTWKNNAISSIKDQFDAGIASINSQKGVIAQNKNNMKMQLLQEAISLTNTLNTQDQQMKQQLASFAVESMQEAEGRTFTPEEVASVYNQMMQQNIQGSGGQATAPSAFKNLMQRSTPDEYENLLSMQA